MSNKLKILVVEDEEAISNFIATTLKANDYNVIMARTGKEALSMIPSHCPDVILLDLGLPDIDGIDILQQIREWSNIPVIVVSAKQIDICEFGWLVACNMYFLTWVSVAVYNDKDIQFVDIKGIC